MEKTYLGDGVYAVPERGMLKLTSEDGVETLDTIFLEPSMLIGLLQYARALGWPDGSGTEFREGGG